MNEQDKAARFSAQVDQLLQTPAHSMAGDPFTDDDQALLTLASEMAALDFSAQSRFLRQARQPKGANKMSHSRNGRRALVGLALAVMLLLFAVVVISPVRAFAQELLQSLFVRHDSNTMTTEPYDPVADPTPTPIPAPESLPDLSVADAAALASFAVKELTHLPDGYRLSSVYYDEARDKVTFLYLNDAYLGIVLHQEPAETAETWTIGPDAVIEPVMINGAAAEYVQGAWQWGEPTVPGAIGSTEVVWQNNDPHQQLRWTQDGIAYTVSTTVGQDQGLTQADLIAIAESLE
ncbi:MAG: DUF4367 domain-containing protein [Anaerolineaceae bacterium]|nr:DUF4367 domain-containing protein [Anaerolineaceae bacterium]